METAVTVENINAQIDLIAAGFTAAKGRKELLDSFREMFDDLSDFAPGFSDTAFLAGVTERKNGQPLTAQTVLAGWMVENTFKTLFANLINDAVENGTFTEVLDRSVAEAADDYKNNYGEVEDLVNDIEHAREQDRW